MNHDLEPEILLLKKKARILQDLIRELEAEQARNEPCPRYNCERDREIL